MVALGSAIRINRFMQLCIYMNYDKACSLHPQADRTIAITHLYYQGVQKLIKLGRSLLFSSIQLSLVSN